MYNKRWTMPEHVLQDHVSSCYGIFHILTQVAAPCSKLFHLEDNVLVI